MNTRMGGTGGLARGVAVTCSQRKYPLSRCADNVRTAKAVSDNTTVQRFFVHSPRHAEQTLLLLARARNNRRAESPSAQKGPRVRNSGYFGCPLIYMYNYSPDRISPDAQPVLDSSKTQSKLVDARGLLAALFSKKSRPSIRWVRDAQKRKTIPYYAVGRLIRFSVEEVRLALRANNKVEAAP